MILAIHDKSGEILRIVNCPLTQAEGQAVDGEVAVAVGADVTDDTHYILNGEAFEKAAIVAMVSVTGDAAVVTGIPAGLEVSFDGVITITDSDPLELTVDEPDAYILRIDGGAKYLDTEVEIDFG